MTPPKIKSTAVLIGYDVQGRCVYDSEHVWDKAASVKRLRLRKIRGYLFDAHGNLDQEFENEFNLSTGVFECGHTRFADGTVRVDPPDAAAAL